MFKTVFNLKLYFFIFRSMQPSNAYKKFGYINSNLNLKFK